MSDQLLRYCLFCGKSQEEVKALVAAPYANICNACVLIAVETLLKEMDVTNADAGTSQQGGE